MNDCEWHKGEEAIRVGESIGCPECGALIATKNCDHCGLTFMDWNYGSGDDILSGPAVTSSGDFCCRKCLPRIEREIEEAEERNAEELGDGYMYDCIDFDGEDEENE